ncbi:major facilitator superfamily domain-containing protein 5-like [Dorcoceras hygrometricum]|uniref:Major facilitator superfamily domain-containing protein 5-like n=1 Tax=Dorcoceras hygrometricum TaxID=472368 RepID=A0A2Z7BLL9_9LAMI|nr:major facilitator superfamily domain-containing protein 5-like [Dorcoceras hygrometricum]
MGVVIESEIWEPNKAVYVFLFISSFFSIFLFPARTNSNVFDHAPPVSFLRFQREFLLLYSLSSVMEGLWAVFGEFEFAYYGLNKEQMLVSLCIGYAVSLFIGSFLGVLSDLVGHKKLCLLFYMLHLFVSICKMVNGTPAIWLASICLSLTSSIFSFSFETWMIVEHDKLGQRQDSLNDMFWLMTFFESASFIGSQVLGNYTIDGDVNKNIKSVWNVAAVLAVVAIIYVTRGWNEASKRTMFKDYSIMFHRYVLSDKRIWLLSLAQASVHFSVAAFWVLWAPTVVADGREVSLGLIYPCMLGSKMLGSTGFPWFLPGSLALRTEEYLVYVFIIMGTVLSIVAYDYQEIGLLVTLFCIFHACMGLVLPSFARLRTMYVPNEVRGGMMTLSLAPASAAVLVFLMLRVYYQYIQNSTLTAFAALGLFSAAGCMYVLKKWGKQLHQSRYNL